MKRMKLWWIAPIGGLFLSSLVAAQPVPATPPDSGIRHITAGDGSLPFSLAVKAGRTVYLSGQIGGRGGVLANGFEAQARQVMDNIVAAAKQANLAPENIVKCTVMMADMRRWDEFNTIYRSYFKPGYYPARSAFGATALAFGAQMEVDCIAYDPSQEVTK